MVLVDAAVGEDQNVRSLTVRTIRLHKQTLDRLLQACILIVDNRQYFYLESVDLHRLDLHQVDVGQNRVVDLQYLTVLRPLLQEVAVLADVDGRRGHDFLTDRVDRRVGHLRKQLFEVIKQRLMVTRKRCKRCVNTHGGCTLATVFRHRQDRLAQRFVGITECLLHALALFLGILRHTLVRNL